MRILVAAGGTGGHIYPALAVMGPLAQRRPDLEVRWLGGRRGLESEMVPAAGYRFDRLWLRTLRSVDLSAATLMDPVRLAASVPQAMVALARWRPDVVYTTGGYVAIPVLTAAAALRVPSLLWEGNRLAGRSVRATARLASAIAVTFPGTAASLSPDALRHRHAHPTSWSRAIVPRLERASTSRPTCRCCSSSAARRRSCASIGRSRRRCPPSSAAPRWCMSPASPASRRHRPAVTGCPTELRARYRPFPFLREDMADALVAADLLVGRAGSSTLAEASSIGLPVIVVPYPHAAGHQEANAREMVAAGAARLVPDEQFDAEALVEAAALLADPDTLAAMRTASRALGRPGAARVTGDLLVALARTTATAVGGGPGTGDPGGRVTTGSAALRLTEDGGAPSGHRHPAPAGCQDVPPGAAGALHDDAGGRTGGPVRGGAQPVRAAGHRPLRTRAGGAPDAPRAWLGPGHQRCGCRWAGRQEQPAAVPHRG